MRLGGLQPSRIAAQPILSLTRSLSRPSHVHTDLQRPSLTRRQSSAISINDGDFEWLKSYFTREDESQGAEQPLPSAPVPLAGQLPPMVVPPGHGQKHKHEDTLPSMSMVTQEDVEDEETLRKRRKVGWTNTEDLTILAAVRRIGTQWQRIADNLPGRTADAVRNRWHRLQKTHALNDTEEGRSALDGLLVASGVDPDWCPPELSTPSVSDAIGASAAAAEPVRSHSLAASSTPLTPPRRDLACVLGTRSNARPRCLLSPGCVSPVLSRLPLVSLSSPISLSSPSHLPLRCASSALTTAATCGLRRRIGSSRTACAASAASGARSPRCCQTELTPP